MTLPGRTLRWFPLRSRVRRDLSPIKAVGSITSSWQLLRSRKIRDSKSGKLYSSITLRGLPESVSLRSWGQDLNDSEGTESSKLSLKSNSTKLVNEVNKLSPKEVILHLDGLWWRKGREEKIELCVRWRGNRKLEMEFFVLSNCTQKGERNDASGKKWKSKRRSNVEGISKRRCKGGKTLWLFGEQI